jgi:hypothetical protein
LKTPHLAIIIISLIGLLFVPSYLKSIQADNTSGIEIKNIQVQPSAVKVGDIFTLTATLANNSTVPIMLEGGKCSTEDTQASFLTVMFDNHAKIKAKDINCAGVGWSQILDPGKSITEFSPYYTATYVATESGTANVTVSFPYYMKNQTDPTQPDISQTISKSLLFTILDNNTGTKTITETVFSPLQQFKSGTPASSVDCNDGLQLIIKAEDGSPACVKPATTQKLIERGWAKEIVSQKSQGTTLPASFMPCNIPFPQSSTGVAVLYMPMNSIGKLCVRYSNPDNTPYPVGIRIFDANNINQNAIGITTWNDSGNNTVSKGNSTVVYWIKTGNQSGLYGLTFYCNNWNPFAVGYNNNSSMTASDFPFLGVYFPCPFQPYQFHIDSLTGIGVKYIPYP